MLLQGLLAVFYLQAAVAFPMRLLKVPKIYNALITTKQKLIPSEAFPATTGPVFQPIDISGNPILLNPEAFMKQDEPLEMGEAPRPFAKSGEMPAPIVFYPRVNVYHQLPQSVYPYTDIYQPPPIVVPVQRAEPLKPLVRGTTEAQQIATDAPETVAATKAAFGFITNNSPANSDIPNVPPPPPPMGAPKPQDPLEEIGSN